MRLGGQTAAANISNGSRNLRTKMNRNSIAVDTFVGINAGITYTILALIKVFESSALCSDNCFDGVCFAFILR